MLSQCLTPNGETPKLHQQPGPLSRATVANKAARQQSSPPPADSRSRVIQAQRAAEAKARAEATPHALTPADRRKLWKIADKPISDEAKIIEAFRAVPRLTATDLALDLLVGSPHPRICELRRAGVPIETVGKVRQPWGRGFARPVALYELAEG